MSFEINGTLVEKYSEVEVSNKFKKREFVISTTERNNGFEFTEYIKFQLTQDRCGLIDPFNVSDNLKVNFNLKGRKWEKDGTVTYFTNLEAWKIEKTSMDIESDVIHSSPKDENIPLPGNDDLPEAIDDADDLPF